MSTCKVPIDCEGDDGDEGTGEMWRDYHIARQAKRGENRERSTRILSSRGVLFDSRNGGAHLIIQAPGLRVDFWPGTGKYMSSLPSKTEGRGVFRLLKSLQAFNYPFTSKGD